MKTYTVVCFDDCDSAFTHEDFKNYDDAVKSLKADFEEMVKDRYDSVESLNEDMDISDGHYDQNIAYLRDWRGCNYDWKILEIDPE